MPKSNQSVNTTKYCQTLIYAALVLLFLKKGSARFPEGEGGIFVRIEAATPFAAATDEKDIAFVHLRRWGLGSQRQFAELAEPGTTAEAVMVKAWDYSAVVVVVLGEHPPQRRNITAGQPFISVDPYGDVVEGDDADPVQSKLPLDAINRGAHFLESFLTGPLFPVRLATRRFGHLGYWDEGPSVVYDVSEGIIYLDSRMVAMTTKRLPARAQVALGTFVEQLFGGLGELWGGPPANASTAGGERGGRGGDLGGVAEVAKVVARIAAAALTTTMAAQVPVWFCVACPLVLGLLAPFVFNLGLTAVAQAVCEHYSLPDDQCNELWYGAFALAMVLSLASAIPIVFVCRLPECARGSPKSFYSFAAFA
ncbi:g5080 [Coccomyxa elongata]